MTEQEWMIRCEVFSSARDWEWPQKYDTIPRPWEKGSEILKIMTCPMYRLSVDASVLLGGRKFLWRERKEKISFKRSHYLLYDRKAPKEFLGVEEVLWQSLFEKTITSDSHVRMDFLEPDFSETDSLSGCVPKKCLHHLSDTWQSLTAEIREAAEKRDRYFRLLRETVRLFECKRVVGIVYENNGAQYAVRFNLGNSRIFIEE